MDESNVLITLPKKEYNILLEKETTLMQQIKELNMKIEKIPWCRLYWGSFTSLMTGPIFLSSAEELKEHIKNIAKQEGLFLSSDKTGYDLVPNVEYDKLRQIQDMTIWEFLKYKWFGVI